MVGSLQRIKDFPGIRQWREYRFNKEFDGHEAVGCFRGVYPSFSEALQDLPPSSPTGYDQPGTSQMYWEVMQHPREWDYPVLYWLSRLEGEIDNVFDFGGHVGILFYGLSPFLRFKNGFSWIVYDVPEVTHEGQRIAENQHIAGISFTNSFERASGCDVLLASGSLQYFEEPFFEMLPRLDEQPKRIIINMIPLHHSEEFVTLNSMPASYCPYKVYNKQHFLDGMEQAGWVLKDLWENQGKACHVPFHEHFNGSRYYGMYYSH